jgi:hypothetical protein
VARRCLEHQNVTLVEDCPGTEVNLDLPPITG